MPINYRKYPPDWEATRKRILGRANNRCEYCGLANYTGVWSVLKYYAGKRVWIKNFTKAFNEAVKSGWVPQTLEPEPYPVIKRVKVILTIHHKNHDPGNWKVKDEDLVSLCQKCHLEQHTKKK